MSGLKNAPSASPSMQNGEARQDQPSTAEAATSEQIDNKVKIFLSHKNEDEDLAISLRQLLCRYAGNRLKVHLMEEIPPGNVWLDWIEDNLATSNILLLLYTDPEAKWDWVMHEAGHFAGQQTPHQRCVICLHHPRTDPPGPVQQYHNVPANIRRLKRWLQIFYGTTASFADGEPINEEHSRDEEELNRQAGEIAALFEPCKMEEMFIPHHFTLSIEDLSEMASSRDQGDQILIPDTAEVKANDRTLADIFALGPGEWQWAQLRERVSSRGDTRWMRELGVAIIEASKRYLDVHLDQTFRAVEGGKIYRPLLYRVDFMEGDAVNFHVLFTKERAPKNVAGSGRLGVMFKLLQWGPSIST